MAGKRFAARTWEDMRIFQAAICFVVPSYRWRHGCRAWRNLKLDKSRLYSTNTRENFDWLLSVLQRLRPDLAQASANPDFLQSWLISSGINEYTLFKEHEFFKKFLNTPEAGMAITPLQDFVYKMRPDVSALFPLPEKAEDFRQWFFTHGIQEHGLTEMALKPEDLQTLSDVPAKKDADKRPFGVNLIGYAFGELGIGENLRMLARALKKACVPFAIIDFPPGGLPQKDRSMEEYVGADAPYSINIFCMTALETARCYLTRGRELFCGRYNIGSWHWELERWPEEWLDLSCLMDEIWVASNHVRASLQPFVDVPVHVMPLATDTGEIAPLARKDFGLPEDAYLFCFAFDFNSFMRRKNPEGALAAFQLAFPENENVGLVIKAHDHSGDNEQWEKLKEIAARDGRIHIIEKTMRRPETLALYKNCDCYLSLHRAEGFGLGMAEALLLGLDVIATGYSGNVDFCRNEEQAHLVDYQPAPLKAGDYPYWQGQKWAEPDLAHAARIMRACARNKRRHEPKSFAFSLDVAGERYKKRLQEIWQGEFGGEKTGPAR